MLGTLQIRAASRSLAWLPVENAVAAAKEAFETWSRTHWNERAKYITKAKEALMEIRDDMAELIMQEAGKPVSTFVTGMTCMLIR